MSRVLDERGLLKNYEILTAISIGDIIEYYTNDSFEDIATGVVSDIIKKDYGCEVNCSMNCVGPIVFEGSKNIHCFRYTGLYTFVKSLKKSDFLEEEDFKI